MKVKCCNSNWIKDELTVNKEYEATDSIKEGFYLLNNNNGISGYYLKSRFRKIVVIDEDDSSHPTDSIEGISDSGNRVSYGEGKAFREPTEGKGRYDLLSPFAEERLAKWFELGAKKYKVRNWEKGMPYSRYLNSAKRHINSFVKGLEDEDHITAAIWNLMAIVHHQGMKQDELDDLPHYLKEKKDE